MAPSEELRNKKSTFSVSVVALVVLATFSLLVLIGLSLVYAVESSKKKENYQKSPQEELDQVAKLAIERVKRMNGKRKKQFEKELKMTPEKKKQLMKIAKMFDKSMDTNVDPCEDFYKFACGNYHSWDSTLEKTHKTLQNRKWEALLNINMSNADDRVIKVYKYLDKIAKECKKPFDEENENLFEDISNIIQSVGGSPILDANMSQVNPFMSAMLLKQLTGVKTLFDVRKDRDTFNPRISALYISFNIDFLDSTSDLDGTGGYNQHVFKTDIPDELQERYTGEYDEFYQNEFVAGNVQKVMDARKTGKSDVSVYFEDALELAPNVTVALLSQVSEEELRNTRLFWQFENDELLVPIDEETLIIFDALVAKYWWSLQTRIVDKFLGFIFNSYGSLRSKRLFCSESARPALNYALLHLMVNKYDFGEDKLLFVRKEVESIRHLFAARIFDLDWMDPITKNKALNKLNRITPRMIGPPFIYDDDAFQEYYQDLPELQGNETLMEILEGVNRMHIKKQFYKLGYITKTIFESFLLDRAFQMNAFYSPMENTINILLGYMQPPLLDLNYPKFHIHAILGEVIGHEMMHGFDTRGSNFDLNGKYRQWMTEESRVNFLKKAECFVEQFSQFCYPQRFNETRCLNGSVTSGEVIADDGGSRLSYLAFKHDNFLANTMGVTFEDVPKLMSGFENYTVDQLFFLSYASQYCSAFESEDFNDPHPPGSARIVGTLRNSPFFSMVYNCPKGSGMNPKKKCVIW